MIHWLQLLTKTTRVRSLPLCSPPISLPLSSVDMTVALSFIHGWSRQTQANKSPSPSWTSHISQECRKTLLEQGHRLPMHVSLMGTFWSHVEIETFPYAVEDIGWRSSMNRLQISYKSFSGIEIPITKSSLFDSTVRKYVILFCRTKARRFVPAYAFRNIPHFIHLRIVIAIVNYKR